MTRAASHGLPVDDDILDRILHFAFSVNELASMALSSKAFYTAFSRHPTAINRATAYNIAGPALPQAIRVLQCPQYVSTRGREEEYTSAVETSLPAESEIDSEALTVTTAELRKLERVANIAIKLENLYSIRYKDRTSKKSKLLVGESWRFRRALYRIMLFSKFFSVERYMDEQDTREENKAYLDLEDDARELADINRIKAEREMRRIFLEKCYFLDLSELADLQVVSRFLSQIMREAAKRSECISSFPASADYGLVFEPEEIYEVYVNSDSELTNMMVSWVDLHSSRDLDQQPLKGYLSDPINALSEAKGVGVLPDDATQWSTLFGSIVEGENDVCQQCAKPEGMNLWADKNWEHVPGVLRLTTWEIADLIPGNLVENVGHPEPWETLVLRIGDYGLSAFLDDLFAVKKSPEFDTWNKDDWICLECLKSFITANVTEWFVEHRRRSGAPILKNCRYGYNCTMQTHNAKHANTLNHFCEEKKYFYG